MTKLKTLGAALLVAVVLSLGGTAKTAAAAAGDPFVLGVQQSGGGSAFCIGGWTLKLVPDLQCYNECMIDFINCKVMNPYDAAGCQAAYNGCRNSCGSTIIRVPC